MCPACSRKHKCTSFSQTIRPMHLERRAMSHNRHNRHTRVAEGRGAFPGLTAWNCLRPHDSRAIAGRKKSTCLICLTDSYPARRTIETPGDRSMHHWEPVETCLPCMNLALSVSHVSNRVSSSCLPSLHQIFSNSTCFRYYPPLRVLCDNSLVDL